MNIGSGLQRRIVRCEVCGHVRDAATILHCPRPHEVPDASAPPEARLQELPSRGAGAFVIAVCQAGHAYSRREYATCPHCAPARTEAGRLRVSLAIAFAVLTLPAVVAAGAGFQSLNWRWPLATSPLASGEVVSAILILAATIAFVLARGAVLTGAERGLYWLGCALVCVPATWSLSEGLPWRAESGASRAGTAMIGAWLVLASVAAIYLRRRGAIRGAEAGLYWLGCAFAATMIVFKHNAEFRWTLPNLSNAEQSAILVACILVVGSAALLANVRRRKMSRAEMNLYWVGSVPAVIAGLMQLIALSSFDRSTHFVAAILTFCGSVAMILLTQKRIAIGRWWLTASAGFLALGVCALLTSRVVTALQTDRQSSPLRVSTPGNGETSWFKDCSDCPEMLMVPSGNFIMGSPPNELGRSSDEGPQRKVTITQPFAVGKFEVTFAEWDACVADGGCKHRPSDEGWGRGRRPVINVSWKDAQEYVAWLSLRTGKRYRLPSEAEWEYVARAGTTTPYAFGDTVTRYQAQFSAKQTAEVGSFPANRFGLYDLHGNVWEWCEDQWHADYRGAPLDGSVWAGGETLTRVRRGGSWSYSPGSARSAYRFRNDLRHRSNYVGFRVAPSTEGPSSSQILTRPEIRHWEPIWRYFSSF